MFDDGSDELFNGFWPFMKRALIVLFPIWIYLIFWSLTNNILISAISAGFSIPTLQLLEKIKLKQKIKTDSMKDNVIK